MVKVHHGVYNSFPLVVIKAELGILQPFGKFFHVGFPQKFSGNSGTFELLVNMGKAALESLKATVGFSLVALTKQVFQLFVTQRIYFFKGESALLKELNVLLYRVARNVCLNGNRLFATPMIVKSQYLSYFVHADRRVGHNLRVILPQKYGYSYSSKTNGDNWSVSSEIPWSFSAGTGGHFIPKSGGQYKRKLHDASHINVQLVQEADRVSFTVQDDGKGFEQQSEMEGMGLRNIRQRVEAFQGKMNIYSSSEGTEVHVELELNKEGKDD